MTVYTLRRRLKHDISETPAAPKRQNRFLSALQNLPGPVNKRIIAELPSFLSATGRSLRSGASAIQAVSEAALFLEPGPLKSDMEQLVGKVRAGFSFEEALQQWAQKRALPQVSRAAAALSFSMNLEITDNRAIESVVSGLNIEASAKSEMRALSAQSRFSALVVMLLPLFFICFSAATDRKVIGFLLTHRLGWICLAAGLSLNFLGILWMNRLLKI